VHDANHQPLAGVTVNGDWSSGATGTAACTTGTNGSCTVSKSNLKTSVLSVKYTVTGLVKTEYTYQATSNEATEITVNQK
jgi:serine protease AprX